ncbi:hypothetical protein I4641_06075 [Waterburya agarophytonicola K14]|uniref:Uncharacterized protein n=1 Tax=Waterburya agarophytonicola KI4 TaxID=2874699 RepID=A0A964BNV1_9CYAN|nr:hypothetical protein [Waterburya agarophytonicola]MCC0176544.1 hypothetical protein [Waterburya agarophytonicola KI4]
MKYINLQQRLRIYQVAGLSQVKLNSPQSILEAEYQRCLNLGLSQSELEQLVVINKGEDLSLISPLEIYSCPEKFLLKVVKAKAYDLGEVENLLELKLAFPIFKNQQYDFRTKVSWSKCVYFIDNLTKNSQDFEQFKQDIEAFIVSIQEETYHQLTGEIALEEAYDDLSSYISWWKGAQWEYTLSTQPSTLDLLKRAWLEQYLAQHDLSELLMYSPMD